MPLNPASPEQALPSPRRDRPAEAGSRRLWAYLGGAVVLAGSFVLAWQLLHTPGWADSPAGASSGRGERRTVAVAYVDVEGGVRNLFPTRPGRVTSVSVEEGVEVAKDAVLLQVDDTIARHQEAEALLAIQAAEQKLTEAEGALALHDLQVRAQQAAVQAAEADDEAADAQASKARRYVTEKIRGGAEDVRAAEAVVKKARAGLAGEQGKLAGLIAAKEKKLNPLVAQARTDIAAKKEQHQKAVENTKAHKLLAPAKGKVLRRVANVGEVLGASAKLPALIFCPSGDRIVRAEVEQEFASRVFEGQKAEIEDDATGGNKWTGKVSRVSDWYAQRRSVLLEPLQINDVRTLEVVIKLEKGKAPLRIGQRVRVTLDGAN